MKNIGQTILLSIFALLVTTSDGWCLPDCPDDTSVRWHNCYGPYDFPDGSRFRGEWQNGKRNGEGTNIFTNGDMYHGNFKDDQRHGHGMYVTAEGRRFVGEFKDGYSNGQGTMTWLDGRQLVGEWKDGKMNGQGSFVTSSGNKYVGEFKDGKFNGHGTYTWANGNVFVGEYKENKRHGQGMMTYADGSVSQGVWEFDEFVRGRVTSVEDTASNTNPALSALEQGVSAARNRDYDQALRILTPLAERGDTRALFYLGHMFLDGKGVERDERLAATLFHRSAIGGSSSGEMMLGILFFDGLGVNQNLQKALMLISSAADKGNSDAKRYLTRKVQKALTDAGYDAGPDDGLSGPRTRDAITAYRRDNGLGQSTEIDLPFAQALLGEQSSLHAIRVQAPATSTAPAENDFSVKVADNVLNTLTTDPAFLAFPEDAVRSYKMINGSDGSVLEVTKIGQDGRSYTFEKKFSSPTTPGYKVNESISIVGHTVFPLLGTTFQIFMRLQEEGESQPQSQQFTSEMVSIGDVKGSLFPIDVGSRMSMTVQYRDTNGADDPLISENRFEFVVTDKSLAEPTFPGVPGFLYGIEKTLIQLPEDPNQEPIRWQLLYSDALGTVFDFSDSTLTDIKWDNDTVSRNLAMLASDAPVAAEPVAEKGDEPEERSIKQRLQELRNLVDEGLVTEAEAAEKRKAILDGL